MAERVNKRYYWLQLSEGFFRDKKIKKLRKIAGGDTYTIIYLKLMLATMNTNGVLTYEGVEESLAEEVALDLDEDEENVQVTLNYLLHKGLMQEIDTGEFLLPQVPECIGSETASTRRSRLSRENQKALQCNTKTLQCNTTATPCNETATERREDIDIDIDLEKIREDEDIEKERDIDTEGNISAPEVAENVPDEPVAPRERIDYTSIMNLYNSICVSFPACRNLSDNRKKMIKACFKNGIKGEDFERAFRLSEDSPFLKGMNNRGWSANFDWIIKPNNIVKILDGNYTQNTNTPTKQNFAPNSGSSDSLEDFYSMASEWANKG